MDRGCPLLELTAFNPSYNSTAKFPWLLPRKNGFVDTVILAYNKYYALVIRPDDVWLAILSRFNFFVNANAELLRASFVAHEGQRELVITANNLDFSAMSRRMVDLIKNVVDPTLRDWVLPNFTTTTVNDITVSAVLLMTTLKKYFSYGFCGIIVGSPGYHRGRESGLGHHPRVVGKTEIVRMILQFVAALDAPDSQHNADFWQKVAHYERGGSGPSYYSDWINTFNAFDKEGVWLGNKLNALGTVLGDLRDTPVRNDLVLDGTPFHRLDSSLVPPGYVELDVKLNDDGKKSDYVMVAGMIGMKLSSSKDQGLSSTGTDRTGLSTGTDRTVRPVAG
ncbi:hypothetical protein DFH09DRAFT_1078548 [Mycena vulgaris]|nr:hypothetical protein DFH09DRAFT_1078548 [Mycena vulgaris]